MYAQAGLPDAHMQAGLLDACTQPGLSDVHTQAGLLDACTGRLPDVRTQGRLPNACMQSGYLMYTCWQGYWMHTCRQRRGRMGPSSMPQQGPQFVPCGGPGIPKTSWALGDAGCTHMQGDVTPGYIHGGTRLDAPIHMIPDNPRGEGPAGLPKLTEREPAESFRGLSTPEIDPCDGHDVPEGDQTRAMQRLMIRGIGQALMAEAELYPRHSRTNTVPAYQLGDDTMAGIINHAGVGRTLPRGSHGHE
ncbi:hypothetical protein FB451DRAFT_1172792 [Mycena latifolia]|nr:hypothetical protein FB451DRAFT_1172792 [Mycena latifolia]